MSVIVPDGDGIASSLPSQSDNEQDVNLGDISERDKVWDKHRAKRLSLKKSKASRIRRSPKNLLVVSTSNES